MWLDIPRSVLVVTGIAAVLASQDLPRAVTVSTPATGFSTIQSKTSVTPSLSAAGASGSSSSKSVKASSTGTASGTTTASIAMASPWKNYVSIDDEQYRIPADNDTIDLVLDDGDVLTLKSGSVSLNDQTISISPDLSGSPLLIVGGKSLAAGEGFDGNDSSGISSSISTLSKLNETYSSIDLDINAIMNAIYDWYINPQVPLDSNTLSTFVDSAVDDMSKVLSPMRSLVQKSSVELQEIKPDALRVVSNAYPNFEKADDILRSMQKTLKVFPNGPQSVIKRAGEYWMKDVKAGSFFFMFGQSTLEPVAFYNWDDAIKKKCDNRGLSNDNCTTLSSSAKSSIGRSTSPSRPASTAQQSISSSAAPLTVTNTVSSTKGALTTPSPSLAKTTSSAVNTAAIDAAMSRCISAAKAEAGAGVDNILTCMQSTSQTSTSSSSTTTLDAAATSAAALVNGHSDIAIAWQYDDSMEETGSHFHWAVRSFSDSNGDFCSGDPDTVSDSSLNLSNLPNVPFPPSFQFSDMTSARGSSLSKWPCSYEGSSDSPGKIACTGWKNVTCTNGLKSANSKIDCGEGDNGGDINYVPKVLCALSDSDKEF